MPGINLNYDFQMILCVERNIQVWKGLHRSWDASLTAGKILPLFCTFVQARITRYVWIKLNMRYIVRERRFNTVFYTVLFSLHYGFKKMASSSVFFICNSNKITHQQEKIMNLCVNLYFNYYILCRVVMSKFASFEKKLTQRVLDVCVCVYVMYHFPLNFHQINLLFDYLLIFLFL